MQFENESTQQQLQEKTYEMTESDSKDFVDVGELRHEAEHPRGASSS